MPAKIPKPSFTLRESQQEALDKFMAGSKGTHNLGVINAIPGFGKTITALAIAAEAQVKTLIVTTNVSIRDMWADEIKKFFGFQPSIIGGGSVNTDTPIVVGNIQTVAKHSQAISRTFGMLVTDECFDYETMVTLADGTKKKIGVIVNKKLTPLVRSFNTDTGKWENKPIVRHFKNPQKEFMKFTFDNTRSSLTCTENHNIYTWSEETGMLQKQAKDINIGDYVVCAPDHASLLSEAYSLSMVTGIGSAPATGGNRYNIEVEGNHNYLANNKLVSNCHHTPASTFDKVMNQSFAHIKLGLSGTLHRKDGKHVLFKGWFGDNVITPIEENVMIPSVKRVFSR